ncbi:unnamed protein product [Chrysoparadoxa australica]
MTSHHPVVTGRKKDDDPIAIAVALMEEAASLNSVEMGDVTQFLDELRNLSSDQLAALSTSHSGLPASDLQGLPGFRPAPAAAPVPVAAPGAPPAPAPVPPPPPPDAADLLLSPQSISGRQLLIHSALTALRKADDPNFSGSRREMARLYHHAAVYLDVLKAFHALPSELSETEQYVRWRTHQNSHLLENMVQERMGGERLLEDHYIVEGDNVMGKGTYGRVITVTHRGTGREYACKIINITRMEARQVAKLYHEVATMRELDHPHIIRLREVLYTKTCLHLVMDLCEGGELFDFVTAKPGECATELAIAYMIRDMMSAVMYMHKAGVVHRDLKLENWLLQSPGDTSSIQLIDFGLSKHFVEANDTSLHQAVGSTYYVAPEVLLGSYNELCDCWSMGVITYMALSGSPPFYGANDLKVRAKIVKGEFSMPDKLFGTVSAEAKDFIIRLLVMNPLNRMTAKDALSHPWLSALDHSPSPQMIKPSLNGEDLSSALRQYRGFSALKRLVLQVVAHSCSPEEQAVMRETFERMDTDKSGSLSVGELMKALEGHSGAEEVKEMYEALNTNKKEEINYNEFIASTIWTRIQLDEERLHAAFDSLDREGRGFLTAQGVKKIVGMDMDETEVNDMVREADFDGDGKVDFLEFARLWKRMSLKKHHRPLSKLFSEKTLPEAIAAAARAEKEAMDESES